MIRDIFTALRLFAVMTLLTGVLYPAAVTAASQVLFKKQVMGSLEKKEEKVIGSFLLAQKFESDRYFSPRPSAGDYAAVSSAASNQGPTSAALKSVMLERSAAFHSRNGLDEKTGVPAEMVQTSGSGLDPHISPEAARLQILRVMKARGWSDAYRETLQRLIEQHTEAPQYGIFGQERVNVFKLNLAVDSL